MAENKKPTTKRAPRGSSILNEFQYNYALAEEIETAIAGQSYRNMATPGVITAVCVFFTYREYTTHKMIFAILFAIVAVICIVAMAYLIASTGKKKTAALKAFKEAYGEDGYAYKVAVEGGHLRTYRNGKKVEDMSVKEVRETFETERFFCFRVTGEKTIPLKKGAFLKGSVEMCKTVNPIRNQGSNH